MERSQSTRGGLMRKLIALATAIALAAVVIAQNNSHVQPVIWRDNYEHTHGWAAQPPSTQKITGIATWYDATRNNAWYTFANKWGKPVKLYAAAGPALRKIVDHKYMMKPFPVWVTSKKTGKTVKVWVVDWCGCQGRKSDPDDTRLVDLAPAVWEALGVPLGLGVTRVTIALDAP